MKWRHSMSLMLDIPTIDSSAMVAEHIERSSANMKRMMDCDACASTATRHITPKRSAGKYM